MNCLETVTNPPSPSVAVMVMVWTPGVTDPKSMPDSEAIPGSARLRDVKCKRVRVVFGIGELKVEAGPLAGHQRGGSNDGRVPRGTVEDLDGLRVRH